MNGRIQHLCPECMEQSLTADITEMAQEKSVRQCNGMTLHHYADFVCAPYQMTRLSPGRRCVAANLRKS